LLALIRRSFLGSLLLSLQDWRALQALLVAVGADGVIVLHSLALLE
jgi:hypothetical protein